MKIRPGNAINRQYRNARKIRNQGWAFFASTATMSAITANNKDLPLTLLNAGCTFLCGKTVEHSINKMLALREDYYKILNRLFNIKVKSKINK